LLGAIESLLSAVIADGMIGTRHRSNAELVGQGVANLVTPLFGGIPATGAIARTATNVKTGGRSPIAGIAHAVFLLAILALLAPMVSLVPLAALAGVLLIVAYHMSEWRVVRRLLSCPPGDVAVLLVTFFTTVLIDVVHALQLGMLLAAMFFMKRIASLTDARYVRDSLGEEDPEAPLRPKAADLHLPSDVEVFEVQGALFFGATTAFLDALHRIERPPRVLILRMRSVLAIDATGVRALDLVIDRARADGTHLLTSGVQPNVRAAMDRAGISARIGAKNILPDIYAALARAETLKETPAAKTATGAPHSPAER
jgi:SulP family sulfate permease